MFSRYPNTDNAELNPLSLPDTTTRLNASFVDLKTSIAHGQIYWQIWLAIERPYNILDTFFNMLGGQKGSFVRSMSFSMLLHPRESNKIIMATTRRER